MLIKLGAFLVIAGLVKLGVSFILKSKEKR